jgi:translation initiation factor 5A
MSDNEFTQGESGASTTELAEAGRMKPGSLIMLKETFPCKVTAFSTAKPGKHGSAKAMITGKDIFTDKQYEETFGTGDMIPRPIVVKKEYQCLSIEDDFPQLMDGNGEIVEDVKLPEEAHLSDVTKKIVASVDAEKELLVTVQQWGEKKQIISCRDGAL